MLTKILLLLFCFIQIASAAENEVSFKNAETRLSGTVIFPQSPGPHPAVVLLHGSGASIRSDYRTIAQQFAEAGFASLIYDCRPSWKRFTRYFRRRLF